VYWRKQGNGWGTRGSKVREMRHRREQGMEWGTGGSQIGGWGTGGNMVRDRNRR
jgi:hypothetical protein